MLIKPPEETGLYLIKPEELEKYWKQKKLLIKLPEKARQFVIKLPKKLRLYVRPPEELKYLPSIHLSNWLYMRPLERLSLVDRP